MRFVLINFINVAAKSITFVNTCHLMMNKAHIQPENVLLIADN